MRILKFLGVFLGVALLMFFLVFGFNLKGLFTLFENREGLAEGSEWVEKTYSLKGLTEYIGEHPGRVSIASIPINDPGSALYYREDQLRTMGSLSSLLLIIEYARQVEEGILYPGERVPLAEIERFQLPKKNELTHRDALDKLRDRKKIGEDDSIRLDDLVNTLSEFNDLAMFDYLYFLLKPERLFPLPEEWSLERTQAPLPFSGIYILLHPELQGESFPNLLKTYRSMDSSDWGKTVIETARQFAEEEEFRGQVLAAFQNGGLDIKFSEERDALTLFPKTTAKEFGQLAFGIYNGRIVSSEVSEKVREIMSWPMQNRQTQIAFETYGALYDNRMGLLNGVDFGISTSVRQPYVQTVFFDSLQVGFWFHMSSNYMHEDYQQRLIWDPALRTSTMDEISRQLIRKP